MEKRDNIQAVALQNFCIYTRTDLSETACWDTNLSTELKVEKIDDSYGLIVESKGYGVIHVYIPRGAKVTISFINPSVDCTVFYKNIECDLVFEGDKLEDYFEILKEE